MYMTTKTEDRLIEFMLETRDTLATIKAEIKHMKESKKDSKQWKMWVIPVILTVFNTVLATWKIFAG